MSQSFDPNDRLVLVTARLSGPRSEGGFQFALDTGATYTIISSHVAALLGYDPAAAGERARLTTASGIEYVPRIVVNKVQALGLERMGFAVLCHTLPPSARVDGLLGLDFLRGHRLVLDFRNGVVSLE